MSTDQEQGYIIEPVCSRPDDANEVHRECYQWMENIIGDRLLTFVQRLVGVRTILHFNRYNGQCDPSLPGLAERIGIAESTVRSALQAIKARGHWDYPENKGGKGRRHQFTFIVTLQPVGGLSTKPPGAMEGLKSTTTVSNPPATEIKPRGATSQTPRDDCAKPPGASGGNRSTNRSTNTSEEQVRSLTRTTPISTSGELNEANGEASKRTSERSKDEPRALLERIDNGIAYVSVRDHECRLQVIKQYDHLLGEIRTKHPDKRVDKISHYIRRATGGLQ
jgi:hypothetical protein